MINETLTKGTVVRYKDGWMEVRAVFKNTVNLGPIFHSRTTVKGVPISEVKPDYDAWHESWTKSETYMCM
jgi:hypothetical protein